MKTLDQQLPNHFDVLFFAMMPDFAAVFGGIEKWPERGFPKINGNSLPGL